MKHVFTAGVVLVGLTMAGCGEGAGGGGATPDATFEAMKKAAAKGDWTAMVAHTTPESQDVMIGGLTLMTQFASALGGPDEAAKMKPVTELLTKHGVNVDIKDDAKPAFPPPSPEEAEKKQKEMMKKMTANVKNKPACIGEVMATLEKSGDKKIADSNKEILDSKLSDVKIEGDVAKGKLTVTKDGKEKTEDVEFKKINGKWYADMTKTKGM